MKNAGKNYPKGIRAGMVLGLIISLYLTYVHFHPATLYCSTKGIIDCATVLGSRFAVVFGIPLSVYGAVWFFGALWLSFSKREMRKIWSVFGVGGIVYSAAAMSVIGKICIYCTGADVLILLYVVYSLMKE